MRIHVVALHIESNNKTKGAIMFDWFKKKKKLNPKPNQNTNFDSGTMYDQFSPTYVAAGLASGAIENETVEDRNTEDSSNSDNTSESSSDSSDSGSDSGGSD